MYTKRTLRDQLAKIYRDGSDGFMWEAKPKADSVTLDDIELYCWTASEKARSASGPQVIGRIADIHQSIQDADLAVALRESRGPLGAAELVR